MHREHNANVGGPHGFTANGVKGAKRLSVSSIDAIELGQESQQSQPEILSNSEMPRLFK